MVENMRFWNLGGFFSSVNGHIIKWWQLVIQPVLKINNNMDVKKQSSEASMSSKEEMIKSAYTENKGESEQKLFAKSEVVEQDDLRAKFSTKQEKNEIKEETSSGQFDLSKKNTEDAMEVLRRINEEKEEAYLKEIEKAKKKASEEARIAAIMNANKVDVNAFIEAGKVAKEEIAAKKSQEEERRKFAEEKAKEVQQSTVVQAIVEDNL